MTHTPDGFSPESPITPPPPPPNSPAAQEARKKDASDPLDIASLESAPERTQIMPLSSEETVVMPPSVPKDPFAAFDQQSKSDSEKTPVGNRISRLKTVTVARPNDDPLGGDTEIYTVESDPRASIGRSGNYKQAAKKLQEIPNAAHILGSAPQVNLEILENPQEGFLKELRLMIFDACLTTTLGILKKIKIIKQKKEVAEKWEEEFLNIQEILNSAWEKLEDSGKNFTEVLDKLIHYLSGKARAARVQKIQISTNDREEPLIKLIENDVIPRLERLKEALVSIYNQLEKNRTLLKLNMEQGITVSVYENLPTILSDIGPEDPEKDLSKLEERYYRTGQTLAHLFGHILQELTYNNLQSKIRRMSTKLRIQKITAPQNQERPTLKLDNINEIYVCTFLGIDPETILQLDDADQFFRREIIDTIESPINQAEFIKCLSEAGANLTPEMIIGKKAKELLNFPLTRKKIDTMIGVTRGEMLQGLTQVRKSPAIQKLDILRNISRPHIPELKAATNLSSTNWPLLEEESARQLFDRIGEKFSAAMLDRLWEEFRLDIPYQ